MSGDLRHGYGGSHKKPFQRKSQQVVEQTVAANSSVRLVWVAALFLAFGLVLGYFVVYHFATEGVASRGETGKGTVKSVSEPVSQSIPEQTKVAETSLNVVALNPVHPTLERQAPLVYSFYHGLSETEVLVDAEPIPVALPTPYYIQSGTFGSAQQAEKEQARLARLGQTTEITTYQGKRLYYRLRVGPFNDRLTLNKRRNELRRLGVDTLLVKSSKPVETEASK